jgi:hypothetical protein
MLLAFQDLSGANLTLQARNATLYWDFVAGEFVAENTAACKLSPAREIVVDSETSRYEWEPGTFPEQGFYGVFDSSGAAVAQVENIEAEPASIEAIENALLGQRSWDKGTLTETVKRVDGTTAKVFDLTVDATGDVVDKVPRP